MFRKLTCWWKNCEGSTEHLLVWKTEVWVSLLILPNLVGGTTVAISIHENHICEFFIWIKNRHAFNTNYAKILKSIFDILSGIVCYLDLITFVLNFQYYGLNFWRKVHEARNLYVRKMRIFFVKISILISVWILINIFIKEIWTENSIHFNWA